MAFLHAELDELIVLHPPHDLCPSTHEWLLKRAMNGTRRASLLFGNPVAQVLEADERLPVGMVPMAWTNLRHSYI